MTETTQARRGDEHDDRRPCRDCDPGLLDALKCRAKGLQARADYNTAHLDDLIAARNQYEAARAAYSAAETAARPLVKQARVDLDKLRERLECLIDDDQVVGRVVRAFDQVQERIRKCGSKTGCYLDDDCDFDDVDDCAPYDVPARKADIELRTKAAEDVFADLITVPTDLPTRVAALQAEVAAIATAAAGEPSPDLLIRLYAGTLVAEQHARDIWRGFDDVNEYVDCLCLALTCMLKGHAAIAILVGKLAVAQCRRDAEETACTRLRDMTVDEVVATYLRRLRSRSSASDSGDDGSDRSGDSERGRDDRARDERGRDDRDRDKDRARDRDRDYYRTERP